MTTTDELLSCMDLPDCLRQRILCRVPPSPSSLATTSESKKSFVLYLPTVVLRKRHNPAFALACHVANHLHIPLVVLCTILDDNHLSNPPSPPNSPIVMTARRLAFLLEAYQSCCKEWEDHGAGVAIRIHGPGSRTPHHLTLCHRSMVVVMDEPFVDPYLMYMKRIARTCRNVPCYTVDGSTSVPPQSILPRRTKQPKKPGVMGVSEGKDNDDDDGDITFDAPPKAWKWEKQTNKFRLYHINGAYRDGALDAPDLLCKLPCNFFLSRPTVSDVDDHHASNTNNGDKDDNSTKNTNKNNDDDKNPLQLQRTIHPLLPSSWIDSNTPCPGQRPWTVQELECIYNCKEWAMTLWDGADTTVPPCTQTHGSSKAAYCRWQTFVTSGRLNDYAKCRNRVDQPHSVSRISCYLNVGILSIFDVLHDVYNCQLGNGGRGGRGRRGGSNNNNNNNNGCNKFLDEIVKFREGCYVHAFATTSQYRSIQVVPMWAVRDLERIRKETEKKGGNNNNVLPSFEYKQLENALTGDDVWDAMQRYLIDTGELHNNARMTWGKTVVHWQVRQFSPSQVLDQLCCLNDRFALDGLSPPSYGGILWCLGWGDKPVMDDVGNGNGSISNGIPRVSTKWASKYRAGADAFETAKERLYHGVVSSVVVATTDVTKSKATNGSGGNNDDDDDDDPTPPNAKKSRRTRHYEEDDVNVDGVENVNDVSDVASRQTMTAPPSQNNKSSSILSYFSPILKEGKFQRTIG